MDAGEIVSRVAEVYGDLNEQRQLVKPRSSLPCSWFSARESFFKAYKEEYLELTKEVDLSYHNVYTELAFFVDDDLCTSFNRSLDVAAKCRSERMRNLGVAEDESFCRQFIASPATRIQDRKEIWNQLTSEETCPRHHLVLLAETLVYCGALYRAMYDEWVAFANLLAYQYKKDGSG